MNNLLITFKLYRFRILACFFLVVLLINTWFMFHQKLQYPAEVHINLQKQLKQLLHKELQKSSTLTGMVFHKMDTKATTQQNQIEAVFRYSYNDAENVNITVTGRALMKRKVQKPVTQSDIWNVQHIKVNNTALKFSTPIVLLPSSKKLSIQ